MKLNQITLPVHDMQAASEFYRKLGFLQIVDTPHYARFETPDQGPSFSLSLDTDMQPNGAGNGATLYFEHDDLDAWVKSLEAKGIVFETQPQDQRWLWREASLYDPSGNKIKLYHAGENRLNPPWRVEISDEG